MASLARLSVDFVARTAGFSAGVNKAEKDIKGFAGVVHRFSPSLGMLTQKMTSAGGIAKGVFAAGFASAATAIGTVTLAAYKLIESLRSLDETVDIATRLGVETADVIRLGHAFDMMGSDAAKGADALEKMQRNIGRALTGSGSAVKAFERLGLSAAALSRMEPTEAFAIISDRLAVLPTQAEKSAAAFEIFGRSALDSLEAITAGSAAFEHFGKEADRFGLTIGELEAGQVAKTVDSLDRLGKVGEGSLKRLAVAWAPTIEAAANFSTELVLISAKLAPIKSAAELMGTSLADAFQVAEVAITNMGLTLDIVFTKMALKVEKTFADIAHRLASGGGMLGIGSQMMRLPTDAERGLQADLDRLQFEFDSNIASLVNRRNPMIPGPGDAPIRIDASLEEIPELGDLGEWAMDRKPLDIAPFLKSIELIPEKISDIRIATPETPGALLRGSAEAFSAINRAKDSPMQRSLNEIAATNKRMLDELKEIVRATEEEAIEIVLP